MKKRGHLFIYLKAELEIQYKFHYFCLHIFIAEDPSGATVCTTQWNKIQSCYTSCYGLHKYSICLALDAIKHGWYSVIISSHKKVFAAVNLCQVTQISSDFLITN